MDKRNTYVRILFVDYSSAFNTIVPSKLITKLRTLGLNASLGNWILDFLTGRPHVVKLGNNTYVTLVVNDETAYSKEVRELAVWCQDNNLSLNVSKTKELIVDFRKRRAQHVPIHINWAVVERVKSFKLLSVHTTNKLSGSKHTKTVVKRARPR
jgi:hypothetical protein